MRTTGSFVREIGSRGELIMLLVASLACTVVLTVAMADSGPDLVGGFRLVHVLALSIMVGALTLAAAIAWRWGTGRHARVAALEEEITQLRRNLATTEAVLKAEPQVLIFWDPGTGVRVGANSLAGVPGLPEQPQQLLKFGTWLDASSAEQLKGELDALFANGRPFNILLRTIGGGSVEADGRATGGRAVLRIRDVSGHKRDLARILDQHRQLSRDIRASRALLNALPSPVWLRSAEGRIEWVNKAYATAVEATDEAEVRERQIELLEQRQREEAKTDLVRGGTINRRLSLIVHGEPRTHDVVGAKLEDASVWAAIDTTALERVAGELDRQVAAHDRTLDRVATGVAIFDRDQRLTFHNAAFQMLWRLDADWLEQGPSHGEIIDRLRELSRLPDAANYRDWKAKVLTGFKGSTPEEWWHLPDGRTLHVMFEERPDGGMACLYDDATERIALESRYNAMIDVQRETLDHLKEGVALFATDGRLKVHNSAFTRIWKLSTQLLQEGPHIDEIIAQCRVISEEPRVWSDISRAVTVISDNRLPLEGQMARPDGSVIDFATLPLPDGATLLTFEDVTEKRNYERALIERNEALVAADRLKSQFISHVSYELRTPLTNIIGFSELLESVRTGPLNTKQREYLSDVSASSKSLLAIIDDILDLATIDAGALELRLGAVGVRQIVDAAVLGVRDRATRANIRLSVAIAPDVDQFVADEARVRQVLFNLISNAIGFSNAGGLVKVACAREGRMIAFAVEDNGVGIPKEQQRSVLERFVSRSQGSRHRGVGLGLSIVKSLVELHGGDMALSSEPGRGTRVTIRFPEDGTLQPPQAPASERPRTAPQLSTGTGQDQ